VGHWPIATAPDGSAAFFTRTEAYRFEKLDYLKRRIDFAGFAGKRVLDLGCGLGNDAARFAKARAVVIGIDIAPRALELARANFAQRGLLSRAACPRTTNPSFWPSPGLRSPAWCCAVCASPRSTSGRTRASAARRPFGYSSRWVAS